MNNETKKEEEHPYTKAAIKSHTDGVLSGNYPFLHMTPENENTYIHAFLAGASFTVQKLGNDLTHTVFLQDENKIEITEENEKTLHY